MKWLNYHHLFYFRCIANEGTIARAAEKLRLGQPTLSTQLKQLEEALGHSLFERKNRSLVLTETGKVVLDYANAIFRMGDELQEVVENRTFTRDRVEFRLGALDSVPKHLIVSLVSYAMKQPGCIVSILEGEGEGLLRELSAHRLDIVVTNSPPAGGAGDQLYARSVAKVPVAVYGSKLYTGLKRGFPKSLAGQPFVFPTIHSRLRHDLDHYFRLNKIQPKLVAETQDTSVQKLLGEEGTGMVPLPVFAAKSLVKEKKLFRLGTLSHVTEEFWLVSAARRIENPVAGSIMQKFDLKVS